MRGAGLIGLAFALIVIAALAAMVHVTGAMPAAPKAAAPAGQAVTADAGAVVVPVAGVAREAIVDTWGQSRAAGARVHHGTDIPAPRGTPVLAAAAGRIEKLFESGDGGTTLYERSPDGRWQFYYAHLLGYAPGIAEGRMVKAGDTIGYVGDTGNAGPGNYHLHFGLARMRAGEHWWQGEPVNAYPLLAARGGGR